MMFNFHPPTSVPPSKSDTELFNEIFNMKKLILSNVSLCHFKKRRFKESISVDELIIRNIDPNFNKSYFRLIQSYCELNDLDGAKRTYEFVIYI
jgi:hypothetical protein